MSKFFLRWRRNAEPGKVLIEFPEYSKVLLGQELTFTPCYALTHSKLLLKEGERLPEVTRACLDGRVKVARNNPLEIPACHLVGPVDSFPRCSVENQGL